MTYCSILTDAQLNILRPLTVYIQINLSVNEAEITRSVPFMRVAYSWKCQDKMNEYTKRLNELLLLYKPDFSNIDSAYNDSVKHITLSANRCLPKRRYKKYLFGAAL